MRSSFSTRPRSFPSATRLTISNYADAALFVCGLGKSTRTDLRRVRKLVAPRFQTRVIGFVVTGVAAEEGYGPYFVSETSMEKVV